jgi:hypothetical protein
MGFHNLVNTQYFKEAAIDFKKNGGAYTLAPYGSKEYFEYWAIQDQRCAEGYSIGDTWIPGRMYFYLNFTPMWKIDDKVALQAFENMRGKDGKVSKRTAEKILDFPRFTEMQYEWWNFKNIAWNGGTFMGITSPGGKHICCAKTRGAGFSYMEAADGVYNYNFIDGSKSYYLASIEEYLTKDGILNKVQDGLDWVNLHCQSWKQNRQKKNTLMHQRASFLDAAGQERGSMAEILGVIANNPNKVRGKRGRKATFEEAGSFPELKKALEIMLGSLRDGDMYIGQMSVFGTGGEEGPGIEGLEDVFYEPEPWDMLAFPNIWEGGSECGYFVPSYRANLVYYDKDGNCDIPGAIKSDNLERTKKKKSKDPKSLDRRKAEYPQKPSEAFQRLSGNGFIQAEVDAQILRIQASQAIQGLLRYGSMIYSDSSDSLGGVEFIIKSKEKAAPLEKFPHDSLNQDVDLSSCVTICERPFQDHTGKVPKGIYQIVFDAYYKDEAQDRTSLFSIYVLKLDNNIDPSFNRLPVAWYTGRPKKLSMCYDTLFKMANYYNCTVQGEISGGGMGVVNYASEKKILHLVEFEPEMLHNKEIATNQRNKSYLMNMNTDRKKLGMSYLEDWHIEQRGISESGKPILNIHNIYDIAMLREMKKAGSLNTDRLSAMLIGMFSLKENVTQRVQQRQTTKDFYSRELFGGSSSGNDGGMTSLY